MSFSTSLTGMFITASYPKNLQWSHMVFSIQFKIEYLTVDTFV